MRLRGGIGLSIVQNNIGLPKVPKKIVNVKKVNPPEITRKDGQKPYEFQNTLELISYFLINGIQNLPKIIKSFIIPLGIMTGINIILESIPTYTLGGFMGKIVFFLIFITATYNSVIPRTLFWVIVLTIGKKLYRRIKSEGISKTISDLKGLPVEIRKSSVILGDNFKFIALGTIGVGMIVANFMTRNNRFDKAAVVIVLAISIADTLTKGSKTTLFTTLKLIHKDLSKILRKKPIFTDDYVYATATGFTMGLIVNLIFAIIKFDFGGYILGSILAVIGIVKLHINKKGVGAN